jgi:hypothetical protein
MAYAKPVASFADIEDGFIERVHAVVWCTAATVDTRNRPRSRVWHPIWEGKTGRIATNRNALKTKHLARNPYLSLSYLTRCAGFQMSNFESWRGGLPSWWSNRKATV